MQPAKYLEIYDINNQRIAFLAPESDGIKRARLSKQKNGQVTLKFILPRTSQKWAYMNGLHKVKVNGHVFWISSTDEERDDQGRLLSNVQCEEIWVRDLGRQRLAYITVEILSSTATIALTTLLTGTGWTVGTISVSGVHDLETEKLSCLANIWMVQEKWGGVLVFDSDAKTVSLLAEEDYGHDYGVEIRYGKNLKRIQRTGDHDIVTRLIPLGKDGLNIASVNDDKLYIDNFQYTTEVLEDIWKNQEYDDPAELKAKAIEKLDKISRPQVAYKIKLVDLSRITGHELEEFNLGDWIKVFDPDIVPAGSRNQIYKYEYDVFEPQDADVELGDAQDTLADIMASYSKASTLINNVLAPNTSFKNLFRSVINTAATEINGADGNYTERDGVSTWTDPDTGDLLRITPKGLIISSDGGKTWRTAISGKGISAEAGWLGKIAAEYIQIGAATDFEEGYNPVDNHLYFQYSADKVNWHDAFNSATDKYMRQKVGDNGTWSEPARIAAVDGKDGKDGINGVDGKDGTPSYLHIKYADDASGTNMNEVGGDYIGTYVDFIETDSANPADYTWNKVKGADGKDVRKFTSEPVPPYGVGDLWIKDDGATMVCIVARELKTEPYDLETDWRDVAKNKFNAPGYVTSTPEGVKVFDADNNLRVLLGSWLIGELRKFGVKIIDGEIYSSIIRTGSETDKTYIAFVPPNCLSMYSITYPSLESKLQLHMAAPPAGGGGGIDFFNDGDDEIHPDGQLRQQGDNTYLSSFSGTLRLSGHSGVDCSGDFKMISGTKYNVEQTENYGARGLAVRESPEQRYVDEGMGTLLNGECRIDIEPIFMECIEPHTADSKWYIQLTPYADVDLHVAQIGADYFVVKERKGSATTGADFTWSLSATRKDYQHIRFMEVL